MELESHLVHSPAFGGKGMAAKAGEKRAATSALGGAQKRARHEKVDDLQRTPEIRQSPQRSEFLPASFYECSGQAPDSAGDAWADEPLPEEPPTPGLSPREQERLLCSNARPPENRSVKLVARENHQAAAVGFWEDLPPEIRLHIVAMMDVISRSYFVSASTTTCADVTTVRSDTGPAPDDRIDEFDRVRPGVESGQNVTAALIKSYAERSLLQTQWETCGVAIGTQYRHILFNNDALVPDSFFGGLRNATHWKTLSLRLWTSRCSISEVNGNALRRIFAQGSTGVPRSPRALNLVFPGGPPQTGKFHDADKEATQSQVLALMRDFGGPDGLLHLTGLSTIAFPGLERALQYSRSIRRLQVFPGDGLDFGKLRNACPGLDWFSYHPDCAVDASEFDAFCQHHPALESIHMRGQIDIPFHLLRSPRLKLTGQGSEVEAGNLIRRLDSSVPLTHLDLMQVPLTKSLIEAIAGHAHIKSLLSFYWGPAEEIEICRQLLVKLAGHPNIEELKLSRRDDGRISAQLDELRAKNPRIQIEYVHEAQMNAWNQGAKE